MLINALNSGAQVYMADFEDSLAPTLENLVAGQQNLLHGGAGTACARGPGTGGPTASTERTATLMVRPRGLHLEERHLEADGAAGARVPVRRGLFLFHNARELHAAGRRALLVPAQAGAPLGIPLVEPGAGGGRDGAGPAAWQHPHHDAHRDPAGGLPDGGDPVRAAHRAAGLNLGRWDYIFSFIKTFRMDPGAVLPERAQVHMEQPFLRAYARLLVGTCHRRGCSAMGGMSAFVPQKGDEEGTERALEPGAGGQAAGSAGRVRRHLGGPPGPGAGGPGGVRRPHARPQPVPPRSPARRRPGSCWNVPAGNRHPPAACARTCGWASATWSPGCGARAAWPCTGCMEDAATAEICRMQLWQWLHHEVEVAGLGRLERPLFHSHVRDALEQIQAEVGVEAFADGRYVEAGDLLEGMVLLREPPPFLPEALDHLLETHTLSEAS